MNRSSDEVPVATAAPFLRLALLSILLVAAVAGVLMASNPLLGWLTLGVAVIAGPVAVVLDARARNRVAAELVVSGRDRFRSPASPARPEPRPYRAAA